jgi:hypothetical protein
MLTNQQTHTASVQDREEPQMYKSTGAEELQTTTTLS